MTDADLAFIERAVERLGGGPEALLPLLQAIQKRFRRLPEKALHRVCELTEITPTQLTGVVSFFPQFRRRPTGQHIIRVCCGTACHVKGAPLILEALRGRLRLGEDEDTDDAGLFTVEKVACLGCCTLAPVIQIDNAVYGRLTPDSVGGVLDEFLEERRGKSQDEEETFTAAGKAAGEIRVGLGSCCTAKDGDKLYAELAREVRGTGAAVKLKRVGCVGICHRTPYVEVVVPERGSFIYGEVRPSEARDIVRRHFRPRGPLRRLGTAVSTLLERLLTDEAWAPVSRRALARRDSALSAFFGRQKHLATEGFGRLDPTDFDAYRAGGGFEALHRCTADLSPEEVIAEIRRSGLRGRGGAGFPTGEKWARVRAAPEAEKFLVGNGDEGDPGAFMDRMLMESFPFRIIEGAALAAYATGAREGCFYVRAEYPLAVRRLREALARCEAAGLLGEGALDGRLDLKLEIREGAGAFVCGEETALLASLEGRRGMPRPRPPYPAEHGFRGRPTLVNNVETFALVPWILRHGAAAFAALGTKRSKGTKVFALAGKIARGGLIEVPMGLTLREIVEEIGGGTADGKKFKAVLVGGPSGGCVPAASADTPVDYEALQEIGAMTGSGGLVVFDESDCMVDIARYFLEFTQAQSCGRCTFCRIGTRRMLDFLERLCAGEGRPGDLEKLEETARAVAAGSLCGLGRSAPNPVLSTLRHFREEYEAHLSGRCPAGRCRALISYRITDDCIGCTLCAQHCPVDAVPATPYRQHRINQELCTRCGACLTACPTGAVEVS